MSKTQSNCVQSVARYDIFSQFPSNLTELEFAKKNGQIISASRSVKLVGTNHESIAAVIAAKGGSALLIWGVNTLRDDCFDVLLIVGNTQLWKSLRGMNTYVL